MDTADFFTHHWKEGDRLTYRTVSCSLTDPIDEIIASALRLGYDIQSVTTFGTISQFGSGVFIVFKDTLPPIPAKACTCRSHLKLVPDPEWPIASTAAAAQATPWTPERTAQQGTSSLVPPRTVIYRQWVTKQPPTT